MSETTSQRTARLLNMTNAQLIMHAQDLTNQRDELISDLATAEQDSRQKQSRIDRLERERDELLAALEHVIDGSLSLPRFAGEQARAAIARVKGGAA